MSHVFISYARKDGAAFAEQLAGAMSQAGFGVWWDTRNLDPNQDFTAELEGAIRTAEQVIVCVTSDTTRANSYVRREIGFAEALQKPIIPLMVDGTLPPISIINVTRVDFAQQPWNVAFADLRNRLAIFEAGYTPSRDPFHDYLTALYKRIVEFLDKTMLSRVDLHVESSPDGSTSEQDGPADMLSQLFITHGVQETGQVAPVFDNFAAAFAHHDGRVLLLGQPGTGKTTTLLTFARDAVAARLYDASLPLPLLGIVASWDPDRRPALAEWLQHGYRQLGAQDLHAVLNDGTALLLLDGLDELGRERIDPQTTERYDPRQRFMSALPERNQVVVTCRAGEYEETNQRPALNGAVTLRPLDDDQLKAYLRVSPGLWNAVLADDALRELVRTPLLLSLFAFAFAELDEGSRQPLNASGGDLRDFTFEHFVSRRYEHEARKPQHAPSFSMEQIYETLGRLTFVYAGLSAMGFRKYWPSPVEFTATDIRRVVDGHDAAAFTELVTRLHFLIADGDTFRFRHLLLRDHFAYRYVTRVLASSNMRTREGAVLVLGDLGDPRAVPLLTGALSDESGNIRWYAADAMRKLADARAAAPLIEALRDEGVRRSTDAYDQTPPVYAIAAEALVAVGRPAVSLLIDAVRNDNADIRGRAVEILGRVGDPRAIQALVSVLSNTEEHGTTRIDWSSESIPVLAARALEHIGSAEALAAATQWWMAKLSDLSDVPSHGTTQPLCAVAASALELLGTPQALGAIETWWIAQLDNIQTAWLKTGPNTTAHVRFCDAAALALARIGSPDARRIVEAWRRTHTPS